MAVLDAAAVRFLLSVLGPPAEDAFVDEGVELSSDHERLVGTPDCDLSDEQVQEVFCPMDGTFHRALGDGEMKGNA